MMLCQFGFAVWSLIYIYLNINNLSHVLTLTNLVHHIGDDGSFGLEIGNAKVKLKQTFP